MTIEHPYLTACVETKRYKVSTCGFVVVKQETLIPLRLLLSSMGTQNNPCGQSTESDEQVGILTQIESEFDEFESEFDPEIEPDNVDILSEIESEFDAFESEFDSEIDI